jgi:hypothetical protein
VGKLIQAPRRAATHSILKKLSASTCDLSVNLFKLNST